MGQSCMEYEGIDTKEYSLLKSPKLDSYNIWGMEITGKTYYSRNVDTQGQLLLVFCYSNGYSLHIHIHLLGIQGLSNEDRVAPTLEVNH